MYKIEYSTEYRETAGSAPCRFNFMHHCFYRMIAEVVMLYPPSRLREEFHDLVEGARFAAAVKSLYLVESDFDAALEFLL